MISKNKAKYIRSLKQKKYRDSEGVFVAEGPKVVGDLLPLMKADMVVAVKPWLESNAGILALSGVEIIEVSDEELLSISFLQHPQKVMGVFRKNVEDGYKGRISQSLSLALDGVQDPGNLGTIVRVADWFGIETILCSHDTADVYNPKVVQATMGSIAHVNVVYCDLEKEIDRLPDGFPIYGTLLDGDNLYSQELTTKGLIVMGNEGNGISPKIRERVNKRLYIPNFPCGRAAAESLNVAVATAVVCAEFRRRQQ